MTVIVWVTVGVLGWCSGGGAAFMLLGSLRGTSAASATDSRVRPDGVNRYNRRYRKRPRQHFCQVDDGAAGVGVASPAGAERTARSTTAVPPAGRDVAPFHLTTASSGPSDTGPPPEAAKRRANFSLYRCDAYKCEREGVEDGQIRFTNPATTQVLLTWEEPPSRVLVLMKPDPAIFKLAAKTVDFLQRKMGMTVMLEEAALQDLQEALRDLLAGAPPARPLEVFRPYVRPGRPQPVMPPLTDPPGGGAPLVQDGDLVDFVLTLGGDGLLMYSNTLFHRAVPPHMCINLGSMGFLTPFPQGALQKEVGKLYGAQVKISLRMRLSARIIRDGQPSEAFHALNEVVVDRGSSPYLSNMEIFCDDQHLTTVQADGLIIATPTGSTAYSMSAGGSMVHPSVPGILFTPICPHSLSFRPIVFPDSVVLRCDVPKDGRADAFVNFDGKLSQRLRRGDSLVIKMSNYPMPTICRDDSTADWFASLDHALGFNTRMRQKALDEATRTAVEQAEKFSDDYVDLPPAQ